MIKAIKRLVWLLLAVALVVFSVENRHGVALNLPYTLYSFEVPLFALFFLGLFSGLALATVALGWSRLKTFVAKRQAEREAGHLKARLKIQEDSAAKDQSVQSYQAVSDAAKE